MKFLNTQRLVALLLIVLVQLIFISPPKAYAATSPTLSALSNYSVLGGQAVTCTGSTTATGAVGVSSGTSITGFSPSCTADGGTQNNNASAIAAQAENLSTFSTLDQTCDQTFGAVDLTTTFPSGVGPGVYCSTSSFTLSGNLNLTGSGVWIFKTVSTLITSSGSSITGGDACNIWWRVGSSATLGTTTAFKGNILALNGTTALQTGATLNGRVLAQDAGTVTLDANTITGPTCSASSSSSSSSLAGSSTSTPSCPASAPSNNPSLFQIDRTGSTAVLHFTPVNDNLTYYYVAYGLSPGSEQYGVSFPASLTSGAVSFTINDLDPNTTYYFKVRGGNGCAPGGWSNNLTSDSKNPMLPNTGVGPRERSAPWILLTGLLLSAVLAHLPRKRSRLPFKQG